MAAAMPSPLFLRLVNTWRHLVLRSDIDDILLELLGRFSLEKIYASSADRDAYQHIVVTLLSQLRAIFDLQRLTIPSENTHVSWFLGYLVSWEVALRCVEFVLQSVLECRESLWENRQLRDRYLAEFLLSALRVLSLHPRAPTNQRAKDRRERFARIYGALEQVFDSYPGRKSFLLEVCKEVAGQLHADPEPLALPFKLMSEVPNLTSELYPLPPCLQPASIFQLVPPDGYGNWLAQFLALRDVSQFVVAASVQYTANGETRGLRIQPCLARARNAVLTALDNLRLPSHLFKMDMVATFSATFRVVLSDTLEIASRDSSWVDACELDALDALCSRLKDRQIIHRVSDREMTHNISQVVRTILLQDDPNGRFSAARPGLYVMNCPGCHVIGASQLMFMGLKLPSDLADTPKIRLQPESKCPCCRENITLAREVPIARQTWELLKTLRPDADTVNLERHLPMQFQLVPPRPETSGLVYQGYSNMIPDRSARPREADASGSPYTTKTGLPSPMLSDPAALIYQGPVSPQSHGSHQTTMPLRSVPSRPDTSAGPKNTISEEPERLDPNSLTDAQSAEKGKSRWRLKFSTSKRIPAAQPGDSSSLSSSAVETQRLDEISLAALLSTPKAHTRGKQSRGVNVQLSQNSTLALFWTQLLIHVWDVGTSPPTMMRAILPESACILAAVARAHLAYVIGTRDQRLTLRIVNLVQLTAPVVEYRIPSSLWCKSIAIDRQENYVVIGFENSTVRFFNARTTEQPREDRLHAQYHTDCRLCPSVDTLSFSTDGLVLLGSTRNTKTGLIQTFSWRFPFHTFNELTTCRYLVPLHESEDNGVSSAIFRPALDGEDNLVCITTWTQSGTPVLIQPRDGHRSEIRADVVSGRHSKLGSRIQCAAFSPSGRDLVLVNDKGHVFQVSNLNSSPMDLRRIAGSRELTAKSDAFAMAFMNVLDEEHVVVAWADSARATGWVRKISAVSKGHFGGVDTPGLVYETASFAETGEHSRLPAELDATERVLPRLESGRSR